MASVKIRSSEIFQKSRSHLKILGARCVTRSKTYADDTQLRRPGFVHSLLRLLSSGWPYDVKDRYKSFGRVCCPAPLIFFTSTLKMEARGVPMTFIAMLQISRHLFQKTLILIFHFICVCMCWNYMLEKNFVIRTSKVKTRSKTYVVSTTKTSQWMLFWRIIACYCENHTKPTNNTVCVCKYSSWYLKV